MPFSSQLLNELTPLIAWAFQPAASAGEAAPSGGGGAGVQTPAGCDAMSLLPILAMVAVFYFLIIRPQQKRQRDQDAVLKALRKGQLVRTSGGIRGEITDLGEREVTLLVADKTKINVLRSHITGPDAKPEADDKSGDKKAKDGR